MAIFNILEWSSMNTIRTRSSAWQGILDMTKPLAHAGLCLTARKGIDPVNNVPRFDLRWPTETRKATYQRVG